MPVGKTVGALEMIEAIIGIVYTSIFVTRYVVGLFCFTKKMSSANVFFNRKKNHQLNLILK
jgi:hypothetical protein